MQRDSRHPHRARWKRTLFVAISALPLSGCTALAERTASLGGSLYRLLVGGDTIGEPTLLRFYVWHIVGLIVPMAFLIGWHGFRVRRDGGISHRERPRGEPHAPRQYRERLVRTETLAFFLTLATLILIATFFDAPVGSPTLQGRITEDVKAPWIFLWVQELLRVWSPGVAGVLVPLLLTTLLAGLPFLDRSDQGIAVWLNRQGRIPQIILMVILIGITALTLRAALR